MSERSGAFAGNTSSFDAREIRVDQSERHIKRRLMFEQAKAKIRIGLLATGNYTFTTTRGEKLAMRRLEEDLEKKFLEENNNLI